MNTAWLASARFLQPVVQSVAPDRHIPAICLEVIQLLANLAILATAWFVWRQVRIAIESLKQSRLEQKSARALEYIRAWNKLSDDPKRAALYLACRDDGKSSADKIKMINDDHGMRALVKVELNFFEELGIAHKHRLLEEQVAFDFFEGIVPSIFETYRFWIDHRKTVSTTSKKDAEKLFESFSALVDTYKKRSKSTT